MSLGVVLLLGAALFFLLRHTGAKLPATGKTPTARTAPLRIKDSSYTRTEVEASRPAELSRKDTLLGGPAAAIAETGGGLPSELAQSFVEKPLLAERFANIVASTQTSALMPYQIQCAATLADHKRILSSAQLFRKDDQLVLIPIFEPLTGGLLARWTDITVQIAIPAGTLPPGTYTVTLVGARANATWPLQVK